MRRYILLVLLVLLGIPSFGAEDGKVINVRTDNSSLIICVDKDGFLRTLHYGGVIADSSPFADFQFGISKGHGSVCETYPTQGGRGFNEPALAVTHKNGDLNTELRYISHNTEMTENGNVNRTIIHLAGLDENMNYRVTELNVEKSASWFAGKSLSGEFLMKKGVNPPLKKVYESAVFLLEGE